MRTQKRKKLLFSGNGYWPAPVNYSSVASSSAAGKTGSI
jgi:hypothetical protein